MDNKIVDTLTKPLILVKPVFFPLYQQVYLSSGHKKAELKSPNSFTTFR